MKKLRSIFALLLALTMALSLAEPAAAASDTVGTTVRLAQTDGAVSVKDKSGKDKTIREDMRLYNGYSIETGGKSYAYISLDDEKALKLDPYTKVEVKKSGKKLEVSLSAGLISFSVDKPLKANESLEIRTASMVTGVRGSLGWARAYETGYVYGHGLIYRNGEIIPIGTDQVIGAEGEAREIAFEDVPAAICEWLKEDETVRSNYQEQSTAVPLENLIESAEEKREEENAVQEEQHAAVETAGEQQAAELKQDAEAQGGDQAQVDWNELPKTEEGTGTQPPAEGTGTQTPAEGTGAQKPGKDDEPDIPDDYEEKPKPTPTPTPTPVPVVTEITIVYMANDGSGSSMTQSAVAGAKTTIAKNSFSRPGYTFTGWNTKANGSGVTYKGGETVTLNGSLMLYAQWKLSETPVNPGFTDSSISLSIDDNAVYAELTVPKGAKGQYGFRLINDDESRGDSTYNGTAFHLDNLPEGTYTRFEVLEYSGNDNLTIYSGKLPATVRGTSVEEPVPLDSSALTVDGSATVERAAFSSKNGTYYRYYIVGTKEGVNYWLGTGNGNSSSTDKNSCLHSEEAYGSLTLLGSYGIKNRDGSFTVVNYASRKCAIKTDNDALYIFFWSNIGEYGGTRYTQSIKKDVMTQLAPNTFSNPGSVFTGWNTRPDGGGNAYADGARLSTDGDLTLYAQWGQNTAALTRAEVALILANRLSGTDYVGGEVLTPSESVSFEDCAGLTKDEKGAINLLTKWKIMLGDEQGFRPEENMMRSEGAYTLARALCGFSAASALTGTGSVFSDVPSSHWACGCIEYLAGAGIIASGGKFDPNGKLTEGELSEWLSRVDSGFTDASLELSIEEARLFAILNVPSSTTGNFRVRFIDKDGNTTSYNFYADDYIPLDALEAGVYTGFEVLNYDSGTNKYTSVYRGKLPKTVTVKSTGELVPIGQNGLNEAGNVSVSETHEQNGREYVCGYYFTGLLADISYIACYDLDGSNLDSTIEDDCFKCYFYDGKFHEIENCILTGSEVISSESGYTIVSYGERECDISMLQAKATVTFWSNWPNGSDGNKSTQEIQVGVETALKENPFSFDGYSFTGWNEEKDGSGKAYADGEKVTLTSDEDLVLYAQWKSDSDSAGSYICIVSGPSSRSYNNRYLDTYKVIMDGAVTTVDVDIEKTGTTQTKDKLTGSPAAGMSGIYKVTFDNDGVVVSAMQMAAASYTSLTKQTGYSWTAVTNEIGVEGNTLLINTKNSANTSYILCGNSTVYFIVTKGSSTETEKYTSLASATQAIAGGLSHVASIADDESGTAKVVIFNVDTSSLLTWTSGDTTVTLNESTGAMTVSGTGAMADYDNDLDVPWKGYRSSIKSLSIKNGVTSIGKSAFYSCYELESADVPGSVASIGGYAFYGCSSLTEFAIPSGVTRIEDYTFSSCTSLTEVTIPSSVTSVGGHAFYGCGALTGTVIPNGVTNIGDYAFSGCMSLTEVTIPASVTGIGKYAFDGCSSIESLTINGSLTEMGNGVFRGCSNLIEATITGNVTGIGEYAFYGCSSLKNVKITGSVTSIGDSAFYYCSALESITIPASVTSIGYEAFSGCSALKSIAIPEGVTGISVDTFGNCSSLESVTIPASVTSIGQSAFYGCTKLTAVNFAGTTTQWGALLKNTGSSNDPLKSAKVTCSDGEYSDDTVTLILPESGGSTGYTIELSNSSSYASVSERADGCTVVSVEPGTVVRFGVTPTTTVSGVAYTLGPSAAVKLGTTLLEVNTAEKQETNVNYTDWFSVKMTAEDDGKEVSVSIGTDDLYAAVTTADELKAATGNIALVSPYSNGALNLNVGSGATTIAATGIYIKPGTGGVTHCGITCAPTSSCYSNGAHTAHLQFGAAGASKGPEVYIASGSWLSLDGYAAFNNATIVCYGGFNANDRVDLLGGTILYNYPASYSSDKLDIHGSVRTSRTVTFYVDAASKVISAGSVEVHGEGDDFDNAAMVEILGTFSCNGTMLNNGRIIGRVTGSYTGSGKGNGRSYELVTDVSALDFSTKEYIAFAGSGTLASDMVIPEGCDLVLLTGASLTAGGAAAPNSSEVRCSGTMTVFQGASFTNNEIFSLGGSESDGSLKAGGVLNVAGEFTNNSEFKNAGKVYINFTAKFVNEGSFFHFGEGTSIWGFNSKAADPTGTIGDDFGAVLDNSNNTSGQFTNGNNGKVYYYVEPV